MHATLQVLRASGGCCLSCTPTDIIQSQRGSNISLSAYLSLVALFLGGLIQLSRILPIIFPTCPGILILIVLYVQSGCLSFLLSILVETWANLFVPELAWFPFVLILWGCLETWQEGHCSSIVPENPSINLWHYKLIPTLQCSFVCTISLAINSLTT